MLNNKEKKLLKAEAHHLKAIFQIGKDGITSSQIEGILNALNNRELIKVKLLDTCPIDTNNAAIEITSKTKAEVVQIIGHTIVLYKKAEDK